VTEGVGFIENGKAMDTRTSKNLSLKTTLIVNKLPFRSEARAPSLLVNFCGAWHLLHRIGYKSCAFVGEKQQDPNHINSARSSFWICSSILVTPFSAVRKRWQFSRFFFSFLGR